MSGRASTAGPGSAGWPAGAAPASPRAVLRAAALAAALILTWLLRLTSACAAAAGALRARLRTARAVVLAPGRSQPRRGAGLTRLRRGAGLTLLRLAPDGPQRPAPGLPRLLLPPRTGSGPAPLAGRPAAPAGDRAPVPRSRAMAAAALLGWAVCGLAMYALFLHMSRTVAVNSDGASNALQAWAMLHGNPLLHLWWLSDVSFYTTELPQYMLVELVRGLRPDVVHVAAAMTYTFVVLLAARLAKGNATGRPGLLRACLAAGIMVAPQHAEVTVLMLSPDHVGSTVPVLLMWLLIDRAGRRWYVPLAVCALLACGVVADEIVLLTGVAPVLIVGLAVAYQRVVRERGSLRSGRFGLALAAAGAGGAEAGWRILAMLRSHGGFYVFPAGNRVVGFASLPHNLLETYQGTLLLFGADFMGQQPGLALAIAFAHLAGLGLAGYAVCSALRRLAGADVAVQLMAVATVISLASFALGPNAGAALSSREFAAVLPFGAALAGRTLAARLTRARLVPLLTAVLAVYLAGTIRLASEPAAAAQNQPLAGWLVAHRLSYGLGGYWMASSITLDSGGAVRVVPIKAGRQAFPFEWEGDPGWFNPARHVANFVVLPANGVGPAPGPGPMPPTVASAVATFGQPARAYFLTGYTVLVWNTNLLSDMHKGAG
jgi:hypothetical protein